MLKSMGKEKGIENVILKYLNLKGCFAFKVNTMGVFDPIRKIYRKNNNPYIHRGTSDILGVYKGQMFAIEVKTPETKTRVSEYQSLFLERVIQHGGIGCVLYDLNGAVSFFEALEESMKNE